MGPHLQGSLSALPCDARIRPAVPEWVRLPGPVGRGPGRARAEPQQQTRYRDLRHRQVLGCVPRARRPIRECDHQRVHPHGPVDGLAELLLHVQRPQHLAHLARPQAVPREGLALQRTPLDAVVRPLWHRALPARDDRQLPGDDALVRLRTVSRRAAGPGFAGPGRAPDKGILPRVDHDTLDSAGQRRARDKPRDRVRPRSGGRRVAHHGEGRR